jgi:hypothetical protein
MQKITTKTIVPTNNNTPRNYPKKTILRNFASAAVCAGDNWQPSSSAHFKRPPSRNWLKSFTLATKTLFDHYSCIIFVHENGLTNFSIIPVDDKSPEGRLDDYHEIPLQ